MARRVLDPTRQTGLTPGVTTGFLFLATAAVFCVLGFRLLTLQIFRHESYEALASGQHDVYRLLRPERGRILLRDAQEGGDILLAMNVDRFQLSADPRLIEDADLTSLSLGSVLEKDAEWMLRLSFRLNRPEDPYEPIADNLSDEEKQAIEEQNLPGILFTPERRRWYPEPALGGHMLGFVGFDSEGTLRGRYGLEGFFEEVLAGKSGFLRGERDSTGQPILVGDQAFERAVNGSDVVLTIDRSIQFVVCQKLKAAVERHGADRGSVVVVDPIDGSILAMCSTPDYDPNAYQDVMDISVFNNPVIFGAYEPGSVFKPIAMATALDAGAVTPTTTFVDTGSVVIPPHVIRNSDQKVYGLQTMTQVLENSVNTGMIFALRAVGRDRFSETIRRFGFGEATGVSLLGEQKGDIRALDESGEIFLATTSFGQGITVTPLQLVLAYSAIANGGLLLQPHLVSSIRSPTGSVQTFAERHEIRRVISEGTARELAGMLVSVVDNGHGRRAGVAGYSIGGKTGTAQVPNPDGGGYDPDNTIGSFAGFGPVGNPRFAMVVRIDHPRDVQYAESTAAPLFGDIADFLLRYFEVPPDRSL